MDRVFSGNDIEVVADLDQPHPTVVCTFTPRSESVLTTGFGQDFFRKRGVPTVHFISKRNHWFQVPEMAEALIAVDALELSNRFSSIVTYGGSMGGHAALVFSGPLQTDRVLALSPQFAINGRRSPWTERWSVDTRNLSEIYPLEIMSSRTASIFVVVDPLERFDMHHLSVIAKERQVNTILVPLGGHETPTALASDKLLGSLALGITDGDLDHRSFRQLIRRSRRNSIGHWSRLLAHSQKAQKIRAAEIAYSNAIRLVLTSLERSDRGIPVNIAAGILERHCVGLQKQGESETALSLTHRFTDLYPSAPAAWSTLSKMLWKQGALEDALIAARRALRLNRTDIALRLRVARLLAAIGHLGEAEHHIEVALSLPGKAGKDWLATAQDFTRLGVRLQLKAAVASRALSLLPCNPVAIELVQTFSEQAAGSHAVSLT